MPLILPGNVASAIGAGYEVANSCRFDLAGTAYMHKALGTPTNIDIATFSTWVKFSGDIKNAAGAGDAALFAVQTDTNNKWYFEKIQNGVLRLYIVEGGSAIGNLTTNRMFVDSSAWYNIVLAFDTTQGTAANRVKLYVNGVQETSFSTATYPTQNVDLRFNTSGESIEIARRGDGNNYLDGYLSETVFIDGQQLAASDFGEFDEDSPTIWKPKDVSGLTFGTNGFYLDYEASDNLGNDANGGTDLTEVNLAAPDQTVDTPTNNWCTLNSFDGGVPNTTLEQGNCRINSTGDSSWGYWASTFHPSTGKWYWEVKMVTGSAAWFLGVVESENPNWIHKSIAYINTTYGGYGIYKDGTKNEGTTASLATYMAAYGGDDIISFALDLDNNKLYIAKNGSWADGSGNNDEASPNAYLDLTAGLIVSNPASWKIVFNMDDNCDCEINFGNPPYANSSDAADADGYGAFEYAPPSGYFALCTKNLAEYG